MRFDEAAGWLVGEPGRGLSAMFVMMNAARLHVALQGVGLLDAAWQKADAYARERRQMRAPGPRDASQPADPIIRHPAVRRLLDTQRAWVDAGRVLAYRTAMELDVARHHPDPARRRQAGDWCALVTPVLKAGWTEQAFHGASDCLQVFGGHGYVREWGIEQIVRDSRVAMIYEGTNEIQAQDLLFRKVLADEGRALSGLLKALEADLEGDASAAGSRARTGLAQLRDLLDVLRSSGDAAIANLHAVAGDFLRVAALVLMSWAWALLVRADAPGNGAAAFERWVWPELSMRHGMVRQALA
jgi:hypothetical protein